MNLLVTIKSTFVKFKVKISILLGQKFVALTIRLSRLKPRASEKMRGLVTNNENLFFLLCSLLVFSVKTGHLRTCRPFFALPISVIKQSGASHLLNPALPIQR